MASKAPERADGAGAELAPAAADPPIFANLGAGPHPLDPAPPIFQGWRELRVDVDPSVNPHVVADLTDLSALPAGSVQGVWCSHAIEHVFAHQVVPALAEMGRILSDDGVAVVLTPDLQQVAQAIAEDRLGDPLYQSPAGPITAHDVVFGHGRSIAAGRQHMAHRCGFTPKVLMESLLAAGFTNFAVFRRPGFELAALVRRTPWPSEAARDQQIAAMSR